MNEKFERSLKKEYGIIAESLGFKERKHFFLNKLRPIGYFKSLTPNVSAFMSFRFFGHHKLYSEATVEVGIKYNDISEFLSNLMKEEYYSSNTFENLGYLMPQKVFLHENFYVDTDCGPALSQLFDKIKQYGYEYYEMLKNEDTFFKLLQEGHPLVNEKSEFNLPVLYYLRGEKQKGLACIENEINKRNQRKTDEELLEENTKSIKLVESVNDQFSSEQKNIVVVRSDGQKQLYADIVNNRIKKPKDTIFVLTSGSPSGVSEYYLNFAEAYWALP